MNVTININDGQVAVTPAQAATTPAITDQSAGSSNLLDGTAASTPEHAHTEVQDAGTPSAMLIQEVELALGQLVKTAPAAANLDGINAGNAPL
jgi:hypothetical protein